MCICYNQNLMTSLKNLDFECFIGVMKHEYVATKTTTGMTLKRRHHSTDRGHRQHEKVCQTEMAIENNVVSSASTTTVSVVN